MDKTDQTLKDAVKALERFFTGRLAGPIEVKYDAIHLQLVGKLSSDDIEAIYEALETHSQTVQRWRVQQVNNMLLLSVATEDSERR